MEKTMNANTTKPTSPVPKTTTPRQSIHLDAEGNVVGIAPKPVPKPTGHYQAPAAPTYVSEQARTKRLLMGVAKHTCVYGAVSLLSWYWRSIGQMGEQAATTTWIVCALLAGLSIGRCIGTYYKS